MRYILAASAVLAVTGGIALAGAGMGPDAGRGGVFEGFLQEMDTDKNGVVSRAEIEALNAARAAEIDADKDGKISSAEFMAWHDAQRQKRMEKRLAAMDSDGDGAVSVAEFEAASTWRLARLDRDGDGEIEPREMRRRGDHGHGHSHDHDSRLTPPVEEPEAN
jgi:Ca2+-binding EF-hand superfamily protein